MYQNAGNSQRSFYGGILFFVVMDFATLLGWVQIRLLWLGLLMMLALAGIVFGSGLSNGRSRASSALIAVALFVSYLAVLRWRGLL